MSAKRFLQDERGVAGVEYLILLAAAAILVVGAGLLFNALSDFFASWAVYFGTGS